MFRYFQKTFRNARISISFKQNDSRARQDFIIRANIRFSTSEVLGIRTKLAQQLAGEADAKYLTLLHTLQEQLHACTVRRSRVIDQLGIFERDYKLEIDTAYSEKEVLHSRMRTLKGELDGAHANLKNAKENLNHWHSRSSGIFFGNGGRRLPQHSFFSQDLSDRDHYKDLRDDAAALIGRLREQRNEIKRSLDQIATQIETTKQDRQAMFDLMRTGVKHGILKRELGQMDGQCSRLMADVRCTEAEREAFERQEQFRRGIVDLDSQIEQIIARRDACIAQFDTPEAREERRFAHRAEWLRTHT